MTRATFVYCRSQSRSMDRNSSLKAVVALIIVQALFTCLILEAQLLLQEHRRRTILRSMIYPILTTPHRHVPRRSRRRRSWIRLGRTASWWENFEMEVVLPEEWRENFRMSRSSLLSLSELLRPYIEGQSTVMPSPVSVVKKVACTLFCLCGSDANSGL